MKIDVSNIIDYHKSNRVRISFGFNDVKEGECIVLGKQLVICIDGKQWIMDLNDIKAVHLSMCSRLYNPGIIESNLFKVALKSVVKGSIGTIGQHLQYYMDVDFVLSDKVLKFENDNIYNSLEIINYLKDKQLNIEDPLGLEKIYKDHQDPVMLVNYLNEHFPKLAKQYNLDNPRGIEAIK